MSPALSFRVELQGTVDEKRPSLEPGEVLVLIIAGKSLNLPEPVLSAVNESDYYLTELLEGLEMTSGNCLINGCFFYGGLFG